MKLTTMTANSIFTLVYTKEQAKENMTKKELKEFQKYGKAVTRKNGVTKIWEAC